MPPVGKWRGHKVNDLVTQVCPDCENEFVTKLHATPTKALYAQVRCNGCHAGRNTAKRKGVEFVPKRRPKPTRLLQVVGSRPEALRSLAEYSIADLVGAVIEKFRVQEMRLEATRVEVANAKKSNDENLDLRNRLRAVEAIFRAKRPDAILGRPELAADLQATESNEFIQPQGYRGEP